MRRYWVVLLLICAAGLLIRIHRLDQKSLWFDELATVLSASEPSVERLVAKTTDLEKNPPLHHLFIYYWGSLSHSIWWLRFSSALIGAATVAAVATLGRRVGGETVGLFAAGVAAVNPFLVFHSQQVRMYGAFGLASAGATALFVYLLQRPESRLAWARYAVVCTMGLWTHYLFGLLYFAQAVTLLLYSAHRRRVFRSWLKWQVLILALFATLVPYFLANIENLSEGTSFSDGEDSQSLRWWDVPNLFRHLAIAYPTPHEPSPAVAVFVGASCLFFAGLFLFGAAALFKDGRSDLLTIFALPPVVIFALSLITPIYNPRYFVMIAPLFCVILAKGICSVHRLSTRAVLVWGVAVFSLTSLAFYFYDTDYFGADYAGMDRILREKKAKAVYHFDYESYLADLWLSDHAKAREPRLIWGGELHYWEGSPLVPDGAKLETLPPDAKEFWLVVRTPIHHWERLKPPREKVTSKIGLVLDAKTPCVVLKGVTLYRVTR